jgi:hypothetical protein
MIIDRLEGLTSNDVTMMVASRATMKEIMASVVIIATSCLVGFHMSWSDDGEGLWDSSSLLLFSRFSREGESIWFGIVRSPVV